MTERRATDDPMRDRGDGDHEHHVAEDLAAGQGIDTGPDGIPAEDVAQLATIRESVDQETAVLNADEVDHVRGEETHVRMYEGYLEAGSPGTAGREESVDLLLEDELREDETDNPHEAAEEGMPWVPPVDPPVVPTDHGQIEVAAGFGTSALDEPFDADHHRSFELTTDERTERVREALTSHAQTIGLVDRLEFDTIGSQVIVGGTVDDLDDEDEVVSVISNVEGVTDVVSRIRVTTAE